MSWLDRRLKVANPYASNPSTKDREKAARRQQRDQQRATESRRRHHAETRGRKWNPPWPW